MNQFILFLLVGFGSGIIVFPIGLAIVNLIRNTLERRKIKRMLKNNEFLTPIDPKDFNVKVWENQRYGNINVNAQKPYLDNLNNKIFKKQEVKNG